VKKQEEHIKKVLIMMLLFIYAFGLIKPVLPLVKDVLAHTFFKKSHMATVHYENGRYHLHMELSDEAQKNESKQNPSFSDNEVLVSHIKSDELGLQHFFKTISEINSPYINVSTDVNIPMPLLPPEC
jgi:hypothetical protein